MISASFIAMRMRMFECAINKFPRASPLSKIPALLAGAGGLGCGGAVAAVGTPQLLPTTLHTIGPST
jgi:hypothetical protein